MSGGLRRSAVLAAVLAPLLACCPGPASAADDLAASLVGLGEAALAQGDAALAAERFQRALDADPDSVPAYVGLARVDLARGDRDGARSRLDEALARAPDDPDALGALATIESAEGAPGRARAALERALAGAPGRADLHAALARLTGRAPGPPARDLETALARAAEHPYDPAARLAAGAALARAGRAPEAARHLGFAVWLGDLDPASARRALSLLPRVDEAWRERRIVPVHVFADETVRREPSWRMRLRLLLRGTSNTLDPFLGAAFVPVSMRGFRSEGAGDDLAAIGRALTTSGPLPPAGVVVAFTERRPPRRAAARLGEAEFLGRSLVVRLDRGAVASPTLVHEVLHLYGAVHVSDDVDSVMNPNANTAEFVLDPVNARIVHATRDRRFGPGGVEANVLPFVDVDETLAAYTEVLRVNLALRRLGLEEALREGRESRFAGAARADQALALDDHLADVSRFVGVLLARRERYAQASQLFEVAARLYGPRTPRGVDARRQAERLRALSPPPSGPSPGSR